MKSIGKIFSLAPMSVAMLCALISLPTDARAESEDEIPSLTGLENYSGANPGAGNHAEGTPEPTLPPNHNNAMFPTPQPNIQPIPQPTLQPSMQPAIPENAQPGNPALTNPAAVGPNVNDPTVNIQKPDLANPELVNQPQKEETIEASQEFPPPVFNKTMMFNPQDVEKVEILYDAYIERLKNRIDANPDSNDKVSDILSKINVGELQQVPDGIYLNSIIYRSEENASAWINGKKYDQGVLDNSIRVVKITPQTVELEWKSKGYNFNFKEWEKTFPSVNEGGNAESELPASKKAIRVDSVAKSIYATLRINQHLDLNRQYVREGRPIPPPPKKEDSLTTKLTDVLDSEKDLSKSAKDAQDRLGNLLSADDNKVPEENAKPIDGKKDAVDVSDAQGTASFNVEPDGHFKVPAKLDGADITFKVDTGATVTIISSDDAKRIGINVDKLDYNLDGKIADGSSMKAAEVVIDNFKIKDLEFKNVTVFVAKGSFAEPLLGMSFFSKVKKFSMENGVLTITK